MSEMTKLSLSGTKTKSFWKPSLCWLNNVLPPLPEVCFVFGVLGTTGLTLHSVSQVTHLDSSREQVWHCCLSSSCLILSFPSPPYFSNVTSLAKISNFPLKYYKAYCQIKWDKMLLIEPLCLGLNPSSPLTPTLDTRHSRSVLCFVVKWA